MAYHWATYLASRESLLTAKKHGQCSCAETFHSRLPAILQYFSRIFITETWHHYICYCCTTISSASPRCSLMVSFDTTTPGLLLKVAGMIVFPRGREIVY